MLITVFFDANGSDHVIRAQLQAVDPDGQEVELGEITLGHFLRACYEL